MKTEIVQTEDGSNTLFVPELDEHYHSTHGAVQESNHVFIKKGLEEFQQKEISIFEVGFGTGLNAILSYEFAEAHDKKLYYHSVEKYPLAANVVDKLNYNGFLSESSTKVFQTIHNVEWEVEVEISSFFKLKKIEADLTSFQTERQFDLIYFDAFAPSKQSEMWTEKIFQQMYDLLKIDGILTTYSAKGDVKRALKASGFAIEKHPGPPGKREMLRGVKK